MMDFAKESRFVTTHCLERKRPVWDIDGSNHLHREAAKRMAINTVQGTSAEMIKLAMTSIHESIIEKKRNGIKYASSDS